jgi:Holliday junction DNA helicase RuvA
LAGQRQGESHDNDVEQALMALGYNEREARQALRNLPPGLGVSEGIKWALKALSV